MIFASIYKFRSELGVHFSLRQDSIFAVPKKRFQQKKLFNKITELFYKRIKFVSKSH